MTFDRLRHLAWIAALCVPLALASPSLAAIPTIYVHYAASCTFSVVGDDGSPDTSVPPGPYQVVVDTPFAFANELGACSYVQFHMLGPGVSISTNLGTGDSETEQFTVTLQPSSTYTLQDDGRPAQSRRSLATTATGTSGSSASVGSSSSTSSSTASGKGGSNAGSTSVLGTPISTAFRGTLSGSVSAAGKLTLTKGGRAVTTVKAGRYSFAIKDTSASAGFAVQEIRKPATTITGVAYVGSRTVSVVLKPGQWLYFSPSGKKSFFVVSA